MWSPKVPCAVHVKTMLLFVAGYDSHHFVSILRLNRFVEPQKLIFTFFKLWKYCAQTFQYTLLEIIAKNGLDYKHDEVHVNFCNSDMIRFPILLFIGNFCPVKLKLLHSFSRLLSVPWRKSGLQSLILLVRYPAGHLQLTFFQVVFIFIAFSVDLFSYCSIVNITRLVLQLMWRLVMVRHHIYVD